MSKLKGKNIIYREIYVIFFIKYKGKILYFNILF